MCFVLQKEYTLVKENNNKKNKKTNKFGLSVGIILCALREVYAKAQVVVVMTICIVKFQFLR